MASPAANVAGGTDGGYVGPVTVAFSDPTPDAGIAAKEAAVEEVGKKIAEQPEEKKEWSTKRYVALCFGLSVVGVGIYLLVQYLERKSQKQPIDDLPPLDPDTSTKLSTLVQSWQDMDDATYWNNLADYIDANPGALTGMDQAVFLRATISMCPDDVPWIWDTEKQKSTYADELVALAGTGDDTAAMYRAVTTKHVLGDDGTDEGLLTRAAAADVLLLAVCWIYHLKTDTSTATNAALRATPAAALRTEPARHAASGRPARPSAHTTASAQTTTTTHTTTSAHTAISVHTTSPTTGRPVAAPGPAPSSTPLRTRPVAVVTATQPGRHPATYLRALTQTLESSRLAGFLPWPALDAAPGPLPQVRFAPPTADTVEGTVAALGAARQVPLLPGERLRLLRAGRLAEPYTGMPAGTPVAVRETTLATLCLLFPTIAPAPASTSTGQATPPAHRALTAVPAAADTSGSSDWEGPAKAALSLAGNLSFMLPAPWGPIGAAASTLIEMLLPSSDDDPLGQAISGLEDYLRLAEIEEAATYLKGYSLALQQMQGELTLNPKVTPDYINGKIDILQQATGPNGELFTYISKLAYLRTQDEDHALPVYVLGQSLAVLSQKMTVQLQAELGSIAEAADDAAEMAAQADAWLGTFVDLRVYTIGGAGASGCVEELAGYIEGRCTDRLSQIKAPVVYKDGWTFVDEAPGVGDDYDTHYVPGSDPTTINANFAAYIGQVSDSLDTRYGTMRQTMHSWRNAILDWVHHQPPQPPSTPPAIDPGTAWQPPPAAGTAWAANTQVRYAAMNVNSSGPSALSDWSAWTDLDGRAHPTLRLAADPLRMTSAARVYHQFRDTDDNTTKMRLAVLCTGADYTGLTCHDTADH
jgi:hypothetical protein